MGFVSVAGLVGPLRRHQRTSAGHRPGRLKCHAAGSYFHSLIQSDWAPEGQPRVTALPNSRSGSDCSQTELGGPQRVNGHLEISPSRFGHWAGVVKCDQIEPST